MMSKDRSNIFTKWIALVKNIKDKQVNKKESYVKHNEDIKVTPKQILNDHTLQYNIINKINDDDNIDSYKKKSLDIDHQNSIVKNFFIIKLRNKLKNIRKKFGLGIKNIFLKNKIDAVLFDTLEEKLLLSDVGTDTTNYIIDKLKQTVINKKISNIEDIYVLLRNEMLKILSTVEKSIVVDIHCPFIILVVGVNGVGKTTTIGKLVYQYKKLGKSVMLAAADTFRAAAIEQLQEWGIQNAISVIASHIHADPAAVVFDSIKSAQAKKIDILIIDTAGRLHNKINLMKELKKIKDVIKKVDKYAPHEIMLVLDACNGQNSLQQTEFFHKYLNLTGITLTKLDSTAKGGIIFSIAKQFSIPIRYIGIGEKISDLKKFNSHEFIQSIF